MKIKTEYILAGITALCTLIAWAFADTFNSLDKNYFIPIKVFIVFIIFFVCALISLVVYISIQKKKTESLENKITELTHLTRFENYDVLCDSQGNKYCPYHKTTVTHSGLSGYAEDSYWCPTCKKWFEREGVSFANSPWLN